MKLTLYIRARKPGRVDMHTSLEDEPNYDTPRVSALSHEIRAAIDRIIDECYANGYISYGGKTKKLKTKTSKEKNE